MELQKLVSSPEVQYLDVVKQKITRERLDEISLVMSFNNLAGTISGPCDLEGSSSRRSLLMPSVLISI